MGFFDLDMSDPANVAKINGALLGASKAFLQPYGNVGTAIVGASDGARDGFDNYQKDYAAKQKLDQDAAQKNFIASLFGGNAPMSIPGMTGPGQTQVFAQAYPEAFLKRMFASPEKPISVTPGTHLYDPSSRKDVFSVPEAVKPPPTAGGMYYDQTAGGFKPIPGYTEQAKAIAEAGRAPIQAKQSWQILTDPKTNTQYRYDMDSGRALTLDGQPYAPGGAAKLGAGTVGFTPEEGGLMGALAEKGISLPAGMRSKDQQKALYQGILQRNPGKSPDEIANLIKTGQIEFGAQKKETQTAAGVAGKVEVAQNEMEEFVPLVREAAANVPRGKFVPLNRLMQIPDSLLSDPNLKVLKGRINALLNAYDMLAARGGTDVDKRAEVRSLLTSADGPEALNAQLNSFLQEASAAHRAAVKATRVPELSPSGGEQPPPPAGPKPSDLPANAKMQLKSGVITEFGNGTKWTLKNGQPVQVQ